MATEVLRTVKQARRGRRRSLGLALGLGFGVLALATAWWAVREGDPVERALGLELPAGTRLIHGERGVGRYDDGTRGDYEALYLSATLPTDTLYERLAARSELTPYGPRRLRRDDGAIVVIAPAREVPATRTLPVMPVAEEIPLGTRSWIVVWRGPLPPSTAHIALPPYGES